MEREPLFPGSSLVHLVGRDEVPRASLIQTDRPEVCVMRSSASPRPSSPSRAPTALPRTRELRMAALGGSSPASHGSGTVG